MTASNSHIFRPRARILKLLGEELIGNQRLAIFELVKNAYDADALNVAVTLSDLGTESASISVLDDGHGMDEETIRKIWFVPGADHRGRQRAEGRRTKRFGRLPLGEKGLGRFAVHKLGDRVRMVTRDTSAEVEFVVDIDWSAVLAEGFLDEVSIDIVTRSPETFPGERHGTKITVEGLRQKDWSRGDLRRLYRQITSISSPFSMKDDFSVSLSVPGREDDLSGLPTADEILDKALWRFEFHLSKEGDVSWEYEFVNRLTAVDIEGRSSSGGPERLQLDDHVDEPAEESMPRTSRRRHSGVSASVATSPDFLAGIGPVTGTFYVFDRDKDVLPRIVESDLLTRYLNENGGIRVYRDGIRVYNYGERGDDWLGLDLRRVNQPSLRISRNVVIGAISLDLERSTDLVEKTNREGFVENDAYARLRRIVLALLATMEAERQRDKDRLRKVLGGKKDATRFDLEDPLSALRKQVQKIGASEPLKPYIDRIESEFASLKSTLVHAGFSGIGLAVVFHEVDRGVRELLSLFRTGGDRSVLERRTTDLSKLLDGFSTLLRRSGRKDSKASDIIRQARDISNARFRYHSVSLVSPTLDGVDADFVSPMARELMIGALTNIIDNSLYWLRVRWSDETAAKSPVRKIYIGTSRDIEGGISIVVADTGPGFRDDPELLAKPFFTRRPDGMGLGLYYVKLAMELSGGELHFPSHSDLSLPDEFTGAVLALVFPGAKEVP